MSPLFVRSQAKLKEIDAAYERAGRMIAAVAAALAGRGGDPAAEQALVVLKARTVASVYSGLEKILEDVAETVDGGLPTGRDRHRDLILQLRTAVPNGRPALFNADVAALLDELRRFRHIERNVYSIELRGLDVERAFARMEELRQRFPESLGAFQAAMERPAASG